MNAKRRKKIIVIMPSMFIGGAERSLLGMLEKFDYEKTEITLFLYRHEGEFLQYVPESVKILPEMAEYRTFDVPIKSLVFSRRMVFGIRRIYSKILKKAHCFLSHEKPGVWMSMQYTSRCLQPLLPDIPGDYDLGIMYLGVPDTLLNKVNAKKKIAWCHTDYDSLGPSKRMDMDVYSKLDGIIAVSDLCRDQIIKFYPSLKKKVRTIENIIPENLVFRQLQEEQYDMARKEDDQVLLLSIGRFSYAKNFDSIPAICKGLVERGVKVLWYLIGYGNDEQLIRSRITENRMEDHVIILGEKDNPYPYIKDCDLYVQPSRFEGKCVTVREAQMLGKPVIITRYATSENQIDHGIDGVIVPMSVKGCVNGIYELISSPETMKQLAENCSLNDYTNSSEIRKIEEYCR